MSKERDLQNSINKEKFNWDRALEAAGFFARRIDIPEARDRDVSNWEVLSSIMNLAIDFRGREFKHNVIFSDDGGGRMLAILIKNMLAIKRKEAGGDIPAPVVYFISPHNPDLVNTFVDGMHGSLGNVLVATELIRNGTGTRVFGDALKRYDDVRFEVASISSVIPGVPEQLESEYTTKVFVGESRGWGVGEVFHKQPFNAVGGVLIEGTPHLKKLEDFDPPIVVEARMNILTLAQEAAKII